MTIKTQKTSRIRARQRKEGFNMVQFKLNPLHFDKWMHQNKANYIGEFFDGVLLDNFVIETPKGFAFIYESYVNPNQSEYLVKFVRHKEDFSITDRLFSEFIEREEKAEAYING